MNVSDTQVVGRILVDSGLREAPVGEEAEWLATSRYGPRVAPHLENFREMYGVAEQDAEAWTQYRRHGHG